MQAEWKRNALDETKQLCASLANEAVQMHSSLHFSASISPARCEPNAATAAATTTTRLMERSANLQRASLDASSSSAPPSPSDILDLSMSFQSFLSLERSFVDDGVFV